MTNRDKLNSVGGPKHVVKTGKTTVLDAEQARKLLDSIRITRVVTLPDGTTKEVACICRWLPESAFIRRETFGSPTRCRRPEVRC